ASLPAVTGPGGTKLRAPGAVVSRPGGERLGGTPPAGNRCQPGAPGVAPGGCPLRAAWPGRAAGPPGQGDPGGTPRAPGGTGSPAGPAGAGSRQPRGRTGTRR